MPIRQRRYVVTLTHLRVRSPVAIASSRVAGLNDWLGTRVGTNLTGTIRYFSTPILRHVP